MSQTSREIQLAARPVGEPKQSDFRLAEVEVPDPGPGEVLVRNRWMSVDPYMRGRMTDRPSYVPPFQIGATLEGGAVGEVVASNAPELAAGTTVLHNLGWREYAVVPAGAATPVDTGAAPEQAFLGILGMPGLTAYVGLLDMAGLRDGDVVFRLRRGGCRRQPRRPDRQGARAPCRRQRRLRGEGRLPDPASSASTRPSTTTHGDVYAQLHDAAPDGIDVYFDNVGGEHLEAAIAAMRPFGRIALCGAISQYNATEPPPGIRNLVFAVGKRLTLRGFIVTDNFGRMPDFVRDVGGWLREGKIRYRETVVEGIERAPDAFIGLLRGENTGKMLVKL